MPKIAIKSLSVHNYLDSYELLVPLNSARISLGQRIRKLSRQFFSKIGKMFGTLVTKEDSPHFRGKSICSLYMMRRFGNLTSREKLPNQGEWFSSTLGKAPIVRSRAFVLSAVDNA